MARKKSSFDYDELEPKIQEFLRQKEREINELLDRKQLRCRYSLGEKILEVRSFLKQENKNCYNTWVKKHILMFQKDGAFTWEFNKAWNQVEEYLNFVIEDKDYLRREELDFDNPECYLIIGYDLSEQQLRKIRTKVRLNPAIKVRTYDDLIIWA